MIDVGYDLFQVGNNIRRLRENNNLTQMQVVDALGVSYTHYAKVEEGMRGMSIKMLCMLIDYFKVDAKSVMVIHLEEAVLQKETRTSLR